ncbi:DNA polymerase III subunit beta [Candidatus Azambacteria bacterium]|nr:DNA polymerase III subunit beta [Candidatus Azambacteria bacterium]
MCLQENLKNSISHLERIASKNQSTPILNNILLKTGDGSLILFTTNLELGLHMRVPCKVERKGELVVPIKSISYFIQNLPNMKITIEEKEKNILIEAENIKTTIPTVNKNEFPLIPKLKNEHIIKINPTTFKTALTQVLNSVAVSHSISEISGIFFNFKDDVLKIASTDSFRLSEKTIYKKKEYQSTQPHSFILPQKTAQELTHLIEQEDQIIISIEQNQIGFTFENGVLTSRLISGTYPNYEQIIPKTTKTKFILNKSELISKVKLASAFASKLNSVYFTVHAKKGIVEIKSSDETKGEFTSIIHTEVSGENTEAAFNYKYILDGLSNIFEDEVVCELNGPSAPASLIPKNNNYRYVLMPIKI